MNTDKLIAKLQSNNYLMLAAAGIGIYLVYQIVQGFKKAGEAAADAVSAAGTAVATVTDVTLSKPIADFINWITLNKPNVANAQVIFQTGVVRPITDLKFVSDAKPGQNFFIMSLNNQRYRIYARTPNGYYPAVLDG